MLPHTRILLLCAVSLPGCAGSVTGENREKAGLGGQNARGSGGDPGSNGGVRAAGGGGDAAARPASTDAGVTGVSSADSATPATPQVCPLQQSGAALTEADCHLCFPPGRPCDGWPIVSGLGDILNPTPEEAVDKCVTFVTGGGASFWCLWYADGVPFDQSWGAGFSCKSNPGTVYCGGGI